MTDQRKMSGWARHLGFVAVALFLAIPCGAASIPSWLDQAITEWNGKNPDDQMKLVKIKDSFVWYSILRSEAIGQAEIRARAYAIVEKHGYTVTAEEELVTTARPPMPTGRATDKKCWSRSFTLDIDTGRQRLLTTNVCEDATYWLVGFRILE